MSISEKKGLIGKLLHKLIAIRKFNKTLKKYNPDIVHSHLESSYSLIYSLFSNTNIVFTIHSYPDRIFTKQMLFLLKMLKNKELVTLVGCAECVTKRANELLGSEFTDDCVTIYNPIDYEKYSSVIKNRNGNTLIHIGRMDPIKNQRRLLDAFEIAHKVLPGLYLKIIGDGKLKDDLQKYALELASFRNIEFCGEKSDVEHQLANSDCFVLSSDSECCPMTVLEAMASGLPVISTDVGGVKELVQDAGIIVSKDTNKIADALVSLFSDKDRMGKLGRVAEMEAKKYNSPIIVAQYTALYCNLLGRRV